MSAPMKPATVWRCILYATFIAYALVFLFLYVIGFVRFGDRIPPRSDIGSTFVAFTSLAVSVALLGVAYGGRFIRGRLASTWWLAIVASLAVGVAATVVQVGVWTGWRFARWDEPICTGPPTGNLACDVSVIHMPDWRVGAMFGAVGVLMFLIGVATAIFTDRASDDARR